jgi:hypothetical protein
VVVGDDAGVLEAGTVDQESWADSPFNGSQHNFPGPAKAPIPTLFPLPPFFFKTECYTYTQKLTNLHISTVKMEAACTSITSATSPTTQCNNPKTINISNCCQNYNKTVYNLLLLYTFQL